MSTKSDRVDLVGWDRSSYILACYAMSRGYAVNRHASSSPLDQEELADVATDQLFELADKFPGWCEAKGQQPTGKLFWTLLKKNIDQQVSKEHTRAYRHPESSLEKAMTGRDGQAFDGRILLTASETEKLRRRSDLHRSLCDAIAVMPTRWKVMLALRFHEELSVSAVAEIVGQTRSAVTAMLLMITRRLLTIAVSETVDHPHPIAPVHTSPWEQPFTLHRWVWTDTVWPDVPTFLGMAQRDYEADARYLIDMLWTAQGVAVLYGARGTPHVERHAECGTESAHARHQRSGEPIDDSCRQAHARYLSDLRERKHADAAVRARGGIVPDRRRTAAA